jgi:hypothetical protein
MDAIDGNEWRGYVPSPADATSSPKCVVDEYESTVPKTGTRGRTIWAETNDIHWGRMSAEGSKVLHPRWSWHEWINGVAQRSLDERWRSNVWIDHPNLETRLGTTVGEDARKGHRREHGCLHPLLPDDTTGPRRLCPEGVALF